MLKEYSAGAIIFRRSASRQVYFLLILTCKSRVWGFPKGHREDGESFLETVCREVREETGITDLSFVDGFTQELVYPIISKIAPHAGKPAQKHALYYLAETNQQELVVDGNEITDARWLPYEQALSLLSFDNLKKILVKANEFIS